MKFEIDDQDYIPGDALPTAVTKIINVVQSMPDGKLYTSRRIARESGYVEGTIAKYICHPALADFKVSTRDGCGRRNLFGNGETIRAYKQEVGLE